MKKEIKKKMGALIYQRRDAKHVQLEIDFAKFLAILRNELQKTRAIGLDVRDCYIIASLVARG